MFLIEQFLSTRRTRRRGGRAGKVFARGPLAQDIGNHHGGVETHNSRRDDRDNLGDARDIRRQSTVAGQGIDQLPGFG